MAKEMDITFIIVDLFSIIRHLGSMTSKQLIGIYRGTMSEVGRAIETRMRMKGTPTQFKNGAKTNRLIV